MDWTLAPATVAPPPEGTFSAEGGLSRDSKLVGLLRVNLAQLGATMCGGMVGRGNKVCLEENCSIAAHSGRKAVFDDHLVGVPMIAIAASGTSCQMYCQPVVPETKLGERLGRYLEERCEVDDWILVLQHPVPS